MATAGGMWASLTSCYIIQSKKEGKDQETIQSSTTPDLGYNMGK